MTKRSGFSGNGRNAIGSSQHGRLNVRSRGIPASALGLGPDLKPLKPSPRKGASTSPGSSKYQNDRTVLDGLKFDSKMEANRYAELVLLQRAGEITDLQVQQRFELVPAVRLAGAKRITTAIDYVADFTYRKTGTRIVVIEDCKGARTRVYLMKRHMMKALLGLDIYESKPRG